MCNVRTSVSQLIGIKVILAYMFIQTPRDYKAAKGHATFIVNHIKEHRHRRMIISTTYLVSNECLTFNSSMTLKL